MLTAIEDGLFNASAKKRLDELEAKGIDIEISLAREKIEKAPLSREQIIFWINWKDGTKTVTLAEVEAVSENKKSEEIPKFGYFLRSFLDDSTPRI